MSEKTVKNVERPERPHFPVKMGETIHMSQMSQPKHLKQPDRRPSPPPQSRRPQRFYPTPTDPQQYAHPLTEEEREARRRGHAEAQRLRRRAKRARKLRRRMPFLLLTAVLLAAGVAGTAFLTRTLLIHFDRRGGPAGTLADTPLPPAGDVEDIGEPEDGAPPEPEPYAVFRATPATVHLADLAPPEPAAPEEASPEPTEPSEPSEQPEPAAGSDGQKNPADDGNFHSSYAILIDLDAGTILAEKNAETVIHPASMTKILTVLVAAEHITNFDSSVVITPEIGAYCLENNCSVAGFAAEEEVPVMDLFYGTILPSGADAAVALAEYAAGSHEAFVKLMNEKAAELGISETARFANCVGLYDENNVCTVYDMAVILTAAMENDFCREILGRRIHSIPPSEPHPEGITLSNWFIRRIEDHMPPGVEVKGAKTGFISQAGSCAASLAQDASGHTCICVTAMAGSAWQCIFDHVALYEQYGFPAAAGN